jgi:hypothetical protein
MHAAAGRAGSPSFDLAKADRRRRTVPMRIGAALQKLVCLLSLVAFTPADSHAAAMERGVAITDPEVLRVLDASRLGLARLLGADADSSSADLFALPSMTGVQTATDRDFNAYVVAHRDETEKLNLFDRDALNAPGTRFEFIGLVNRMDRAYVSPGACGEIRLIYRPTVNRDSAIKDAPSLRLPMTLSLIMKAKPANADGLTCGELAKRWLALSDPLPADAGVTLTAGGGALEWITRDAIDRIEINIQIARAATDANDFEGRADYLMKVFRPDPLRAQFEESPLENQIDVVQLKTDNKLAAEFTQWLLDPARLAELDRGTVVLPDRFLALSAINETPSHIDADTAARDLFAEDHIVAALAKASAKAPLQNILSPAGFARRLDDMTCAGCHRTRAVGGFHFPGLERAGIMPGAVVAAASPHFFGDQERRRDVLAAFRDGRAPDFSRGFSAHPQPRRAQELNGTTYVNGWGAVCYALGTTDSPDKSFASWTCAEGLVCKPPPRAENSRTGFCFPK